MDFFFSTFILTTTNSVYLEKNQSCWVQSLFISDNLMSEINESREVI